MRGERREPSDVRDVLAVVVDPLEGAGIRYMIIGALAVSEHGDPRMTRDADISVDVSESGVEAIGELFRAAGLDFEGPDRNEFGTRYIVHHPLIPIEVYLSGLHPYTLEEFERAVSTEWRGRRFPVISAEDLVLRKLHNYVRVRGAERDLMDARSIVEQQGHRLDVAYMRPRANFFRILKALDDMLTDAGVSTDPSAS